MKLIDYYLGDNFENVMTVKNFTQRTKVTYHSILRKFLSENPNPQKVTTDELIKYIASRNSRASMAQTHGVLNNFYKHVLKQPRKFGFIPYPKKETKIPIEIPHEEIIERINAPENTKHRLILNMLYGTGLRVSELANLKWNDISRTGKDNNPLSILVNGKGNVQRRVPISKGLNELLIQYCKEYKLNCENSDDFIFGEGYSVKSIQLICQKYCGVSPHKLRHLFSQWLVDNGTELETVRQLLGHQSLASVQIYARTRQDNIVTPV